MKPPALGPRLSVVLLIVAGLLPSCQQQSDPGATSAPAVVTVSQALSREVTDHAHFTGRTAAVEAVDIRARVSGYLTEIAFQPGQEVKQGQLLFRIDPTVYEAALERAQSDVALYQAQGKLAEAENERNRRMVATGAVSREDYERTQAQQRQTLASLAGARASVKTAQQNLTWTRVVSPIDGKAGVNLLTRGNLVVADQTLLTTIVSQDPMYAYFDVDESTMLRIQQLIRQGKATSYRDAAYPIAIGLANEDGFPHRGTIDYVSNQVSTTTGTLSVRGQFPNKERVLTPGLYCRVEVPVGKPHRALLITDRALGNDQGQPFLLLVDQGNQVVRRNVQVGALHAGLREIRTGLQPEEWVIIDGLMRVRPGVSVEPRRRPAEEQAQGSNLPAQGNDRGR